MLGLNLSLWSAALGKGGTPFAKTDAILGAGGLDYAFFDSALMSSMFQDAAGTTPVTAVGQPVGRANVRRKSPHYANQAVNNSRPALQSGGWKFDGSDDGWLSDWFCLTGENCIIAQVDVPASLAAVATIAGTSTGGSDRWNIRVSNTNGLLYAGIGDLPTLTIAGAGDLRGKSSIVAVSCDNANASLFADVLTTSSAKTGQPLLTNANRVGSGGAGSPAQFWPGTIKRIAFGRVHITQSQFQQIRNEWLAAP